MYSDTKLGTEPLNKLIAKMALPSVVAQLINLLYNLVDRIYIGHMPGEGDLALTGLGLCFPIITIISAFSAFAGSGGAPLAAIELGKGERHNAEKILGNAVIMLLAFSVILTVLFSFFKIPLLYAFGASDNTISYAADYLGIYLIGTIFVQLSLGLNPFISAQGRSLIAMVSVAIGAVLNIALDPIFIFTLNMGVKGAALATILSQCISALWVIAFLCSGKTSLRISFSGMCPDMKICGKIASLGISPFIMQSTESAITIIFTSGMSTYGGDLYVGSVTILQSVLQMFAVPLQGFTQGVQPILSYNYGAGNYDRVDQTIRLMKKIIIPLMAVLILFVCIFPGIIASLITDSTALIELCEKVMPVFLCGMSLFGIQMCAQATFVGLGQAKVSLCIALLRKVILIIPLALILPHFLDVWGIYIAEPISDIISAITSGILLHYYRKKLLKTQ